MLCPFVVGVNDGDKNENARTSFVTLAAPFGYILLPLASFLHQLKNNNYKITTCCRATLNIFIKAPVNVMQTGGTTSAPLPTEVAI